MKKKRISWLFIFAKLCKGLTIVINYNYADINSVNVIREQEFLPPLGFPFRIFK